MSMASASNQVGSSCFPSSSSTPHWSHDVFLSFRGTDTRKNFTSHLYKALKDVGIETFIDDEELPTGKEIKPELRKAIQESKMSIIVFSKNYAASRWCLDELGEILECKRTMGQLVLPLFYDVEPSVVRHQTESYEEAFQKFVGEWDKPKVQNWRDALKEAADLSGHVLANEEDGNEAKFIAKIVMKVQREVNSRALNAPEHLIGVDSQVDCIDTLLSIGSNDVRTIGIYGMGGIGKTTVSKAVYNKHLNHFEVGAFVEDIKDVSKQPDGLLRLQERLLNQLQKNNVTLPNCDEGIKLIEKICSSKRVLILLDDLDGFDQIQKLVKHRRGFKTGSRVIIVTRDEEVLKKAQVDDTYEIKALNADESLKLFRLHAFGEGNPFPSEEFKLLSIETTTYCGGLPLALEVIGGHMRGLTLLDWEYALKDFRKNPEKTILDRLKISYDTLGEHGKKIFLDVACIFIGYDRDYLFKFWDGCGFSAENSIRELLNKCLLKVDEENRVRMHDHLRDMGRKIVHDASNVSLKKHSRMWTHQEICDLLDHPKGAEAVEGISSDHFNLWPIALENKAFKKMHQLRFLRINFGDVTGSFKDLFGNLRWLSWRWCPLKSLPPDFQPRKLVLLNLQYSKIEKLWEGVKHLENLKILDLSYSYSLVETPNFNEVRSLERLILRNCERLSTIDPSICQLRSLEELDLKSCSILERLPEELGNMKSLKTLQLSFTLLEGLPDSIGQLTSLVHLRLSDCKKLKTLPTTICVLSSLEELDISCCSNLRRLPEAMGNLTRLRTLNARGAELEELPDSIGHLSSLVHLDLRKCSNLMTLPNRICDLSSLEELDINFCSNLKRLPEAMGNFKRLRTLNASGTELVELPDSIGHLSSLVCLDLSGCSILKTLPDRICDLSSLEELNINRCFKLQQLPNQLGNMVSLRNLYACEIRCQQLPSIENLKKLERLNLCPLFRDPQLRFVLPFKIKSSLHTLKLINCGVHDEDIPDDIGICLLSLKFLDLSRNDFCNLPSTLCQLSNLTELHLDNCKSLVTLPELPPNLHKLSVSGCTAMEKIPNLSNLKHLRSLDLSDCNSLVELKGLENLKLESLDVAGCSDLAMNTTFNESFFQRYFEAHSSISLPKWNFQIRLEVDCDESTISFELPQSLPDNFQGIILWVVYARFHSEGYSAYITNKTSAKKWPHYQRSCYGNRLEGQSWVSCIKSNYFRGGDSIKISVSESNYVKVEKCGVRWLIGSEGDRR